MLTGGNSLSSSGKLILSNPEASYTPGYLEDSLTSKLPTDFFPGSLALSYTPDTNNFLVPSRASNVSVPENSFSMKIAGSPMIATGKHKPFSGELNLKY